jgi:hypothetical protein
MNMFNIQARAQQLMFKMAVDPTQRLKNPQMASFDTEDAAESQAGTVQAEMDSAKAKSKQNAPQTPGERIVGDALAASGGYMAGGAVGGGIAANRAARTALELDPARQSYPVKVPGQPDFMATKQDLTDMHTLADEWERGSRGSTRPTGNFLGEPNPKPNHPLPARSLLQVAQPPVGPDGVPQHVMTWGTRQPGTTIKQSIPTDIPEIMTQKAPDWRHYIKPYYPPEPNGVQPAPAVVVVQGKGTRPVVVHGTEPTTAVKQGMKWGNRAGGAGGLLSLGVNELINYIKNPKAAPATTPVSPTTPGR